MKTIFEREDIIRFTKGLNNRALFFYDAFEGYNDESYSYDYIMPTTREAVEELEDYLDEESAEYDCEIMPNEIYCIQYTYDDRVFVFSVEDMKEEIKSYFKYLGINVSFS